MKKRRKLDVACPNKACKCFNKIGLRNIVRNGKKENGTQNYKCAECGTQFVRTKGTMFYHKKLKKEDVVEISRHIVETNSFRGIARETKHNKNTIGSYVNLIAQHCEQFNDVLIQDLKLGTHEIDEFWSYVKKNKRKWNSNTLKILNKAMRTLS